MVQMLYKSMSRRNKVGRGDVPGLPRQNLRRPLMGIGAVTAELHICFQECGFVNKEYPFSEGGWELEGANVAMVIRFAQRQTESSRPTAVTIFNT